MVELLSMLEGVLLGVFGQEEVNGRRAWQDKAIRGLGQQPALSVVEGLWCESET
jgi:hypothetical protein